VAFQVWVLTVLPIANKHHFPTTEDFDGRSSPELSASTYCRRFQTLKFAGIKAPLLPSFHHHRCGLFWWLPLKCAPTGYVELANIATSDDESLANAGTGEVCSPAIR
jgi:hypothetical protein